MTGAGCIKCTRLSHSHISRKLGLYSLPSPQQSNFGLHTFPPMIAFLLANLHNVYNSHRYNKLAHCTKKWSFPLRISSVNSTKSAVFSGPYFPVFGLYMEIRIQSENSKIRTRKDSVFEDFSRSDKLTTMKV